MKYKYEPDRARVREKRVRKMMSAMTTLDLEIWFKVNVHPFSTASPLVKYKWESAMGEKSSSRIDYNDLETWFRSLHTFCVESRFM